MFGGVLHDITVRLNVFQLGGSHAIWADLLTAEYILAQAGQIGRGLVANLVKDSILRLDRVRRQRTEGYDGYAGIRSCTTLILSHQVHGEHVK